MSTDTQPGGFTGDPTQAFNPPATSGCCGGAATATSCCGSPEATAAGQCCTPAARDQAVNAGAGCCG